MAKPPNNRHGDPGKWPKRNDARAVEVGYTSWAAWCAEIEKRLGRVICGAWGRSAKKPCGHTPGKGVKEADQLAKQRAVKCGRCWLHGALSLAGRDSPKLKSGKYSGYGALLSVANQKHWTELQKMHDRRSQAGEQDLMRMRVRSLLERAEVAVQDDEDAEGNLPSGLLRLLVQMRDEGKNAESGNSEDFFFLLPRLIEALDTEALVIMAHEEIRTIFTTLNRVTTTEARIAESDALLSIAEMNAVVDAMGDLTRAFVPEHMINQYDVQLAQLKRGRIPDAITG